MTRRQAAQSHDEPALAAVPRPTAQDGSGAAVAATALDHLIHERMRLGIVSALAATDTLTFTDLKAVLGATDGNLSVHARKLEDAGYIRVLKSFERRRPKTEYQLTPAGRQALTRYLDHMDALIQAARRG